MLNSNMSNMFNSSDHDRSPPNDKLLMIDDFDFRLSQSICVVLTGNMEKNVDVGRKTYILFI